MNNMKQYETKAAAPKNKALRDLKKGNFENLLSPRQASHEPPFNHTHQPHSSTRSSA
jgi:hypothetical protein